LFNKTLKFKAEEDWNYSEKGPDYWAAMIKQCRSRSQSPVNIIRDAANYDPHLDEINVENLDQSILFNVTNTHFTGKFPVYFKEKRNSYKIIVFQQLNLRRNQINQK
jgi:hypothetical protein